MPDQPEPTPEQRLADPAWGPLRRLLARKAAETNHPPAETRQTTPQSKT